MKTKTEILRWLRANQLPTAGLTSHDVDALLASVALTPLISYASAKPELFGAYRSIVEEMQTTTRHLAFHAIAAELDWGHRMMIWVQSGLADDPENAIRTRALAEPRGAA